MASKNVNSVCSVIYKAKRGLAVARIFSSLANRNFNQLKHGFHSSVSVFSNYSHCSNSLSRIAIEKSEIKEKIYIFAKLTYL